METEIIRAYVGLGSNLGDRAGNLLLAVRGLMEASFVVNKLSGIYETEPVEIETDAKFLNMVAEIHVTNVSPSQMMARLLRIEYLLGRTDKSLKKPRTVDLDLLFSGNEAAKVDVELRAIEHDAGDVAVDPFGRIVVDASLQRHGLSRSALRATRKKSGAS